jgi:hypothetical protein
MVEPSVFKQYYCVRSYGQACNYKPGPARWFALVSGGSLVLNFMAVSCSAARPCPGTPIGYAAYLVHELGASALANLCACCGRTALSPAVGTLSEDFGEEDVVDDTSCTCKSVCVQTCLECVPVFVVGARFAVSTSNPVCRQLESALDRLLPHFDPHRTRAQITKFRKALFTFKCCTSAQ